MPKPNLNNLSLNQLVPYFLMASYLYYIHDISLFKDEEFDMLCKMLYDNWKNIQHPHKYLIKKKSLKEGTGFYLRERDYPTIVRSAAYQLYNT